MDRPAGDDRRGKDRRGKDRRGRQVQAAGGVVWRRRDGGPSTLDPDDPATAWLDEIPAELLDIELVMVHRPRYDDWSLPKGKAEKGESGRSTARREVEEETGLQCRLGEELVTVRYETERGEHKTVRWWAMTVRRDLGFAPNDEVDEVRWVDLGEFSRLCDFPSDRQVVHSLAMSGAVSRSI